MAIEYRFIRNYDELRRAVDMNLDASESDIEELKKEFEKDGIEANYMPLSDYLNEMEEILIESGVPERYVHYIDYASMLYDDVVSGYLAVVEVPSGVVVVIYER